MNGAPGAVWDVAVVGSASIDFLGLAPTLPRAGNSIAGSEFQEAPGGRGANQAVAAARLGARVALAARVGDDARGACLLGRLSSERVDCTHVRRDTAAPTGIVVIQAAASGVKQSIAVQGANARLSTDDITHASGLLARTRVVLAQLDAPLETIIMAARTGRSAGARVVLDPSPPVPLPDELLSLLDLVKPNAAEAAVLTGVHVHDRRSGRAAAEQLLGRGVGAVAVEAGGDGNLLVWPGGECWLPLIPVPRVDTTGAGDALVAALAVLLAEGRSLEEAGPFASAAAALTTTVVGAQAGFPRREAVLALLERTGMRDAARVYGTPRA